MSIKFENVSFTGNTSTLRNVVPKCCTSANEHVFKELNGFLRDKSLTALMGPSGAGKTTLLKYLSDGNRISGFTGSLSVTNSGSVTAVFITQSEKEHLLMRLTVRESLIYASKLKNTFYSTNNNTNHEIIANNLLAKLELEKCANNSVNKCSGGQCKRLAIGLELTSVRKPNFLLLDEPTSGLDSSSGFKVIHLLKSLSQSENMSIIVTIHQPSYKILALFDSIYALTNAGNCIYFGEPNIIKPYLTEFGNQCPELHNPADLLIDLASNDTREATDESLEIAETKMKSFFTRLLNFFFCCCANQRTGYRTINSDYDESDDEESLSLTINNFNVERYCSERSEYASLNAMKHSAKRTILNEINNDTETVYGRIDNGLCIYKTPFNFRSLRVLLFRTIKNSIWREKQFILFRFALHAIIALILSVLYNHKMGREDGCFSLIPSQDFHNCSCTDSRTSLKDEDLTSQNAKFQFFSLLFLMFAALMPTVLTFPDEVKVFLNEHRNGWYSTGSYYLAKTLAEIPIQLLFPFLYTWFIYYITGQIGMDYFNYGIPGLWRSRFAYFILFTELTAFITQGMAFLIGIIFVKSFNITIFVSSSVLLLLFLFSGFFVRVSQMGNAQFLTYFSYVRFAFESLLITLYGLGRCDHKSMNLLANEIPLIRYGSQSDMTSFIIYKFDLKDNDLWRRNFCILLAHLIVWRLLAYCALRCRVDHTFLRPKFIRECLQSFTNAFTSVAPYFKCLGIKLSNILFFIIKFMIILLLLFICVLSILLLIALIVYVFHLN